MVNSPFSCPPPARPELKQSQSATWGWPRFIDNKHPLAEQAGPATSPTSRRVPNPPRTFSLPIRRAENSTDFETASEHSVAGSQKSHISVISSSVSSNCRKAGLFEDPGVFVVPLQPVEPSPKAKDRHSGLFRGEDDDCDSERRRRSLSTITDAPSVAASDSEINGPNTKDSTVSQAMNPRPRLHAGRDTEAILACVQAMPGGFEPKAGRSSTPDIPDVAGPVEDEKIQIRRSSYEKGDDVLNAVEAPMSCSSAGSFISPLPEPTNMPQPMDGTVGPSGNHADNDGHTLLNDLQGTRDDHNYLDHMGEPSHSSAKELHTIPIPETSTEIRNGHTSPDHKRKTPNSVVEEFQILPVPKTSISGAVMDHKRDEPVLEPGNLDRFIEELQELTAVAPVVKAKKMPQNTEATDSTSPQDNPLVKSRDSVEPPEANTLAQEYIKFAGKSDNLHRDQPEHAERSVLERITPDVLPASTAPKANRKRSNCNLPSQTSVPIPMIIVQQPSETDFEQPQRTLNASRLKATPPTPDDSSEMNAACLPRIKRHALYLRKARNVTVREIVLKAMLGRELGKQTKDSLRTLAHGESI